MTKKFTKHYTKNILIQNVLGYLYHCVGASDQKVKIGLHMACSKFLP